MSHRSQRPPRLQLETAPPEPEEKHDCRNTIINCLRDQISQLKYIVELQRQLKMGPYPEDPRGIADIIITTIGRIETKIGALYRMVNGLSASVGDYLRSEVRGETAAGSSGSSGPSGPGAGSGTKGKDSMYQLFPIWESSWGEKSEDVEENFWGTTRSMVSDMDTFSDTATKIRETAQKKTGQKKNNIDRKNAFSETSWGGDDEFIPATDYSSWRSAVEPKHDTASRTNNDNWSFDGNMDPQPEKPPAGGRRNDAWDLPLDWNTDPERQPASGQRNNDWDPGHSDFSHPWKQPAIGRKKVGWDPIAGESRKKPEKVNTNKNTLSIPSGSDWSAGEDQVDSKRKISTIDVEVAVTWPKMEVVKVVNKPQKQQDKPAGAHKRTNNNRVSVNKSRDKWAATVEADHGESNDDGGDIMPGGWPPSYVQTQSQSQIEKGPKPPVTPENNSKTRMEVTVVPSRVGNTATNKKDKKDKKEIYQQPMWENPEGDKKTDECGSTWDSNNKGWGIDEEQEDNKDKDLDDDKNKEKESSQKKSILPANEIYNSGNDDTEWASTQPWTDDESDASDADTISPYKY